jgi:hypothetical protein
VKDSPFAMFESEIFPASSWWPVPQSIGYETLDGTWPEALPRGGSGTILSDNVPIRYKFTYFHYSCRDRDNMTKKLNEEHDQRRIEQMEVLDILFILYVILKTVRRSLKAGNMLSVVVE